LSRFATGSEPFYDLLSSPNLPSHREHDNKSRCQNGLGSVRRGRDAARCTALIPSHSTTSTGSTAHMRRASGDSNERYSEKAAADRIQSGMAEGEAVGLVESPGPMGAAAGLETRQSQW